MKTLSCIIATYVGFSISLLTPSITYSQAISIEDYDGDIASYCEFNDEIGRPGVQNRDGFGYSPDTQLVSLLQCYNTSTTVVNCQEKMIGGKILSHNEALNILRIHETKRENYIAFSRNKQSTRFKSRKDSNHSLSLNLARSIEAKIEVNIKDYGINALNQAGKNTYQNGNNPNFGLACGDHYITGFDQGAMLLISLDINFNSHTEKENFERHSGSSGFLNLYSTTKNVQEFASKHKTKGAVVFKAYQRGGSPELISNILKQDHEGDYFFTTCDIDKMQNCIDAANAMVDYAVKDFPKQLDCASQKGFYPLNTEPKYISIERIGLKKPAPLLIGDTLDAWDSLVEMINENEEHKETVSQYIDNHPDLQNKNADLYEEMAKALEEAEKNLEILASSNQCFYDPNTCTDILDDLMFRVEPVILPFLSSLEADESYKF